MTDFAEIQRQAIEELRLLAAKGQWDELARLARRQVVVEGVLLLGLALQAAEMLRTAGRPEDAIIVLAEASRIQQAEAPADAVVAWLSALARSLREVGDDALAQSLCLQALDLRVAPAAAVSILADIHAQLDPAHPELRPATLYLHEALKELEFCAPLSCGEAASIDDEMALIGKLAAAEAAIERTYRRELRAETGAMRGMNHVEATEAAAEIAAQLRETRAPDAKEFASAYSGGRIGADVKAWWPAGIAALAYRCDVDDLVLSTYCIDPAGELRAFRHDVTFPALRALLNICRRGIFGELAFMADRLTEMLLPPALRETLQRFAGSTLLLCADSVLEDVPWEALGDERQYLGTHFDLVMTPSLLRGASMLQHRPDLAVDPPSFAFVANPTGDLAFADQEARAIADLLRSCGRDAEVTSGCGRDRFLEIAAGAQWLHYAGHADYLMTDPTSSHLRLAERLVTIRDLARTGVAADSVWILNACESAQAGSVNAGRSRVGFPQVLLLEGACAVIAANWPAEDRTSADTLRRLYEVILTSPTPLASAMRRVRRALLDEGRPMHEWAQYRVFGHPFVTLR